MIKIKDKAKEEAETKYKKRPIEDNELIDVFEGMEPPPQLKEGKESKEEKDTKKKKDKDKK